jgi:hypothetical protein
LADDYIKFELRTDADRRRMHECLTAQFRGERLRTLRRALASVTAVVSVPLWVQAGWPGQLARRTVAVAFALFAVLGVALVTLAIREYTWYRRGERARDGAKENGR